MNIIKNKRYFLMTNLAYCQNPEVPFWNIKKDESACVKILRSQIVTSNWPRESLKSPPDSQ